MRNHCLVKNYVTAGAIVAYRIVSFDASGDGIVAQADGTKPAIGVNERLAADAAGERIDVVRCGIAEVEYGDTVTAGQALAADAQGRAIPAAPAAGATAYVIGIAEVAGVAGDIGSLLIAPSVIKTPAA